MAHSTGTASGPSSDDFLSNLYRGGELLAAGKVIEAKDFLERAWGLQPKNEKGQNLLGLTYFKLGLFDRAAEIYEGLVRDNPVDPTLRINLGLVFLKNNSLAKAVREFETACDLQPDHKKAHNYLGLALAQLGEYADAREHFILAGSDAMAQKMERAMSGEATGLHRIPAPLEQQRAQRFAEIEGSEVVAERGGQNVHEDRRLKSGSVVEASPAPSAQPLPSAFMPTPKPPKVAVVQAAVQAVRSAPAALMTMGEETPASFRPVPVTPPVTPRASVVESDWGAHFADDGASDAAEQPVQAPSAIAVPPPAAAQTDEEAEVEDLRFAEDEGPSTFESEAPAEQVVVLLPTAQETEPHAVEAMQHTGAPESEAVLPAHVEPDESLDAASVPEAAAPADGAESFVVASSSPPENSPAPTDDGWHAEALGESRTKEASGVPLEALAPMLELVPLPPMPPFEARKDSPTVTITLSGELLTRMDGLLLTKGQVRFEPELKRFRGRTTDQAFGADRARMMRATGRAVLVVGAESGKRFVPLDLADESAYFREESVFAFEEALMFENGRVPAAEAGALDLNLVHLRGKGKVLVRIEGALRSQRVRADDPVTVPLSRLVGWFGSISPRLTALWSEEAAGGVSGDGVAVELSGEGFVLLAVPMS